MTGVIMVLLFSSVKIYLHLLNTPTIHSVLNREDPRV